MSDSGETPSPTEATSPLTGDWPAQAADAVVDLVETVRDRTIGPLLMVVRALVYGIIIIVVATMAIVLLGIGAFRVVDSYLPAQLVGLPADEVWPSYLFLGLLFTIAGMTCWRFRRPKQR